MNTLIHADIFFFVTTIALVLFTIGGIIIIVYVVKILRDISALSRTVKKETDVIVNDIEQLRTSVKDKGFKLKYLTMFLGTIFRRYKKNKED